MQLNAFRHAMQQYIRGTGQSMTMAVALLATGQGQGRRVAQQLLFKDHSHGGVYSIYLGVMAHTCCFLKSAFGPVWLLIFAQTITECVSHFM